MQSKPFDMYVGSISINSSVFRSGFHSPESGYAHKWRVNGFSSSNNPFAMRLFINRPSIEFPRNDFPSSTGVPFARNLSPSIETLVCGEKLFANLGSLVGFPVRCEIDPALYRWVGVKYELDNLVRFTVRHVVVAELFHRRNKLVFHARKI